VKRERRLGSTTSAQWVLAPASWPAGWDRTAAHAWSTSYEVDYGLRWDHER
jgi:hypothetical protein